MVSLCGMKTVSRQGYLEGRCDRTLVARFIPEPTEESLTRALRKSVDDLLSLGLTGAVTEDFGYYGDYRNPLQAFKNVIGRTEEIPCTFAYGGQRFSSK